MRNKKRALSLLLAMTLLVSLAVMGPAASAEGLSTLEKADALYAMGLFRGMTAADGSVDYALDDGTNRNQGAIMLLRIMGKESTAEAEFAGGAISCPFADMDDAKWAQAGVTWMYTNGYVNGITSTPPLLYGGSNPLTVQHYAVLLLRVLGYSDGEGGDFSYSGALDFAVEKGLLTAEQRAAWQAGFLRAGIVEMSYNALYCTLNGSDQTLLAKLEAEGVIGEPVDPPAPVTPPAPAVPSAAPVTLSEKYTFGGSTGAPYFEEKSFGHAAYGDVDGDGRMEIVYGIRSIFCIDAATGALEWRIASGHDSTEAVDPGLDYAGESFSYIPIQILDYDGDGQPDIFTVTNIYGTSQCNIAVYDGQGRFKTRWTTDLRTWAVKVDDIDGDGKCEVAVGYGVGSRGMSGEDAVYVYNNDGSIRWTANCRYGLFSNSLETVDLTGDGVKDVVVLFDEDRIAAFNGRDGSHVSAAAFDGADWFDIRFFENRDESAWFDWANYPSQSDRNGLMGTHSGLVADDMDGDGKKELVGVSMFVNIRTVEDNMNTGDGVNESFDDSFEYFAPFVVNQDRSRYVNEARGFDWSSVPAYESGCLSMDKNRAQIEDPYLKPVTADLNGDGVKEILFSSYDGKVHCYSMDGTQHDNWPFNVSHGSVVSFATEPTAADLNGDGFMEVIFATWTEYDQMEQAGKLYVLDCAGRELGSIVFPVVSYTGYPNGSQAKPLAADVDGDGRLEIIVSTYASGVCVYEVN